MTPLDSIGHGEALWELVNTVDADKLAASRHVLSLSPSDQVLAIEQLPPHVRRFVVLRRASTAAGTLLALAFRGAGHREIADYARAIPEPAGRLARRWARDDWGYWRRRPELGGLQGPDEE